jgi:SAM-dependent methyltransferase
MPPSGTPDPGKLPRMLRVVSREELDHLAPDDPEAQRARGDLRRINRILRSATILAALLREPLRHPRRILELGAGDGTLILETARRLSPQWEGSHLVLLDRHDLLAPRTREGLEHLGCHVEVVCEDALQWLGSNDAPHFDLVLANLLVHHFSTAQIQELFARICRRTDCFIACEPRRNRTALWASRLIAVIGANAVTRRDAVSSVKAGFTGLELTQLWPSDAQHTRDWQLQELKVRPFSHCFIARRKQPSH